MTHRNAPLSIEGRRRRVERCKNKPIALVAAEMGISRASASKWVNRYRRHGQLIKGARMPSTHPYCRQRRPAGRAPPEALHGVQS